MSGRTSGYLVTALGSVSIDPDESPIDRPLTAARRQLLALLVAAGPEGIDARQLARAIEPARPMSDAALRMAVARLRDHLPDDVIPGSEGGQYVLRVPVDRIDVWHVQEIAAARELPELPEAALLALLSPEEPFGSVQVSGLIEDATYEIRNAQRTVLARIATERPALLSERFVTALRGHCEEDPWNERLVLIAAIRMAQAGDRRGALDLIAATRRQFSDAGLGISDELDALERSLLDGKVPDVSPVSQEPELSLPGWLRDLRSGPLRGARDVLDAADDLLASPDRSGTLVVDGPSGVGKTRALAEIAHEAEDRGWAVLYITPTTAPATAFGAFVATIPTLSRPVGRILDAEHDAETRRARLWSTVRETLANIRPGRPLLLLVDDAQWLDSYSIAFLTHMIGSRPERRSAIVLAGRSDEESLDRWRALRSEAERRGAQVVDVPRLGSLDIGNLVEERCQRFPAVVRARITRDLIELSRGVPGAAFTMLALLDPETGRLPAIDDLGRSGPTTFTDFAPTVEALRVGAAAAVLGRDFGIEELIELLDGDVDSVVAGVDWLLRNELLQEMEGGRHQSTHALVDAAFVSRTPALARARWHEAAARLARDIHGVARHLRNAVPIVPHEQAIAALLRSARQYVDDRMYPEAARQFAAVEALADQPLDLADAISSSRSSDLAGHGREAMALRRRYWGRATEGTRHSIALDLATSGLPEAEPIDGSVDLVDLLNSLDARLLDRAGKWRHARHLARQNAIIGRQSDATFWAANAEQLARPGAERMASVLTSRFVASTSTNPDTRLSMLDAVGDDRRLRSDLRAEYLLVRSIDLYEAGRVEEARSTLEQLGAVHDRPVVRVWHSKLFEAAVTADAGDVAAAEALRDAARDYALDAGLTEAHNAYLIGMFADVVARGSDGDLASAYDAGLLDPAANLIMRASVSKVLHAAGRVREALGFAEEAAREVLATPVSQSAVALALAAPALGLSPDRELKKSALDFLLKRGNSLLIVGAGAACLGPIRRYAAELADAEDAARYWTEAEHLARAAGVERWVRGRPV